MWKETSKQVSLPALPLQVSTYRQFVHTRYIYVHLSPSSINWYRSKFGVDFSALSTYGLNGLKKGDEHPRRHSSKEYGTLNLIVYGVQKNKISAAAEMADRLATIDMGRKVGGGVAVRLSVGELSHYLTQSGLGRCLPPYQVAS